METNFSLNHNEYIERNKLLAEENAFSGKALEYMQKAKEIMYADHYDESDSQSDYFHCAYYINMEVGKYNKVYKFVK